MSRRVLPVIALALVVMGVLGVRYGWRSPSELAPHQSSTAHKAHYQCAMHPQIVSDEPGVCPICHMNLQRVDDAEAGDRAGEVPGHAPFTLSTEKQQLIGVTKARVERRPLAIEIRALGRVAYDPKLYQGVIEYREATRSKSTIGTGAIREAQAGANALVRGARLKLRQQGLSEAQIQSLGQAKLDPVELLLPGKSVWIYAQVYEYEAPLVAVGQTMVVTAPSLPGERLTTQIVAVDPILDPTTRTIRVRGLLATPEQSLRPESFVRVTIEVPLGETLAVPAEAVLDTGEHQVVFVVDDTGRFEPRAVTLGREAGSYYEVRSGLSDGEQVVTSANFLIDSESRFRAALAAYRHSAPAR